MINKPKREEKTLLFAGVSVGESKRPGTLAEAREVSIKMGGVFAEEIDPAAGCFNIEVSGDWLDKLMSKGYLEEKFVLSSGVTAHFDAEWI